MADHGRPGPPHRGVHGDADRLVDHHDALVVVDDPDAVDQLGDRPRAGRPARGKADVEQRARRSAGRTWPGLTPSSVTSPWPSSSAAAGARDAEHPRRGRRRPARRPRPSGISSERAVAAISVTRLPVVVGRSRRVPSSADPAQRPAARSAGTGDVDADVGDVEDRPVRQRQEVDDVPAERARRRGASGRSGCRRRRPAAGPAPPPSRGARTRRRAPRPRPRPRWRTPRSPACSAVPVLNAAPGLRAAAAGAASRARRTGARPVSRSHGEVLGDLVDGVGHQGDEQRRSEVASGPAHGRAGSRRGRRCSATLLALLA